MTAVKSLKLAVVQMISEINDQAVDEALRNNLAKAESMVVEAAAKGAELVILPENVLTFGSRSRFNTQLQQYWIEAFSRIARQNSVWLVAGSLPLSAFSCSAGADLSELRWQESDDLPFATCVVFDRQGQLQGCYRKIHLFDACVADKTGRYTESAFFSAGNEPGLVQTPWGLMGIGICYDLRFPEYFRLLRNAGAKFVVLPAAFTHATGAAHWEVLMRARAIENQLYMAGSNQGGHHTSSRVTWGDSMIIDPWGKVVARLGHPLEQPDSQLGESVLLSTLDFDAQQTIRDNMPQQSRVKMAEIQA